jgi:hypothetical protein
MSVRTGAAGAKVWLASARPGSPWRAVGGMDTAAVSGYEAAHRIVTAFSQ